MRVVGLFNDRRRERIRQKTGVGLIEDYLLRSEVTDYYRLRLLVNSIIGLLFCSCIYYLGWKKLNFADFHAVYGILFKWFMILSIVFAFTISPLFRCAMFCVLLGALGKNGQAPLTMLVFSNLNEGPIDNIVHNYKLTAEIIVCHLQLQARIVSNRVAMFTGPLEELLEKQLTRGLKVLKKAVTFVRKLISPFLSDINPKKTKEDERLDERDHQIAMLAQRRELSGRAGDDGLEGNEMDNMTKTRPAWTSFKTSFGRQIAARMSKRCNDIFTKGVDKCRELFTTLQSKCYEALPAVVDWLVCNKLNMESSCQDLDRRRKSLSICQSHLSDSHVGSSMESDISDVVNMTSEMDKETNVDIRMQLVDAPRLEMDYSLSDITLKVKHGTQYVKALLMSTKQVIQAMLIFFVYQIFHDAVDMISSYRNNIEFNNHYIGKVFWQIDEYRESMGQDALLRIDSIEMKRWKLMKVMSWPTKAELRKARQPFLRWLILTTVVVLLVVVDYYIYDFLHKVVKSSEAKASGESGMVSAEIEVLGEGIVAEFINKMIHINQTVDVETFSNAHCLTEPRPPNLAATFKWLFLPLLVSLLMQVIFSFVIKRVVLNYFLPFMFPIRDRVRIIYLYNKLLFLRSTHRREARARIRFVATRWKINRDHDEGGWFSPRSWFKLMVLDRIFRTGQCLMCELPMRPSSLRFCADCPATYCKYCLQEMEGLCYACQADEGVVTSDHSRRLPSKEPVCPSKDVSTTADTDKFMDHVQKATSTEHVK